MMVDDDPLAILIEHRDATRRFLNILAVDPSLPNIFGLFKATKSILAQVEALVDGMQYPADMKYPGEH